MQKLIVKLGDNVIKEYVVDREVITIGRARDNEIIIENLSVSRNHARLRRESGQFVLVDLNSANGTFVNGVRVSKTELVDGDIISIGKHRIHFTTTESVSPSQRELAAAGATGTQTDPNAAAVAVAAAAASASSHQLKPAKASEQIAAAVESHALIPALVVSQGKQAGQLFLLKGNETTIGRHGTDIRLHDWNVGKRHAVIAYDQGVFTVRDLGSWQGTVLDNEKIKTGELHDGSELIFGSTHLIFRLGTPEQIEALAPKHTDTPDFSAEEEGEEQPVAIGLPETDEIPAKSKKQARKQEPEPEDEELAVDNDDEFAPMTDEELAALEEEADQLFANSDEIAHQAEWEQLEAEKLLAEGGGIDIRRAGSLIEKEEVLRREEEALVRVPDAHDLAEDPALSSRLSVEEEDEEEESALFGGDIPDSESAIDAPPAARVPTPPESTRAVKPAPVESAVATSPSDDDISVPDGVDPKEVRRWSRGLKNRSKIVRREAARKLKELTGIDYEWESDPQ